MRAHRLLPLILVAVIGGTVLAGASASASSSHTAKTTTLRFFFKTTSSTFTSPSGVPLSNNAPPAAGDHFLTTVDGYAGNHSHHAKNWTVSASLYCTVTNVVSNTNIPSSCEGIVAIGGSMVISVSTQNLGSNAATTVYPITGGAGKYVGAKGRVKTTSAGNGKSDNVITIKG